MFNCIRAVVLFSMILSTLSATVYADEINAPFNNPSNFNSVGPNGLLVLKQNNNPGGQNCIGSCVTPNSKRLG